MMTTRQELAWAHGRISELENYESGLVSDLKDREEELDNRQIKIENLEEEVERLKDLLVAYKAEAQALREDNDNLEAQVKRLSELKEKN